MTVKQAIKVLKKHNNLRRGVRGNQQDPKTIVEAIDAEIEQMIEIDVRRGWDKQKEEYEAAMEAEYKKEYQNYLEELAKED